MIYIAFDIDGTLYDCSPIVGQAFALGIEVFIQKHPQLKIPKPTTEEIMKLVGIPVDEIFAKLFPALSQSELQEINDYCTRELSQLVLQKKGIILPGVFETIPVLFARGYGLVTASNGRREYIQAVLDAYELSPYFLHIITLEENNLPDKTHLLTFYINTLPQCELLIMVGDRTSDMVAAEKNNLSFIACAFGHNDEEIAHCRWIAHSFYEITDIVNSIIKEMKFAD
ncbi:MAG: HAD family hydrolase [Spirochaetota bacterium]